jgi:phosphoribosylamine--glycine ligase
VTVTDLEAGVAAVAELGLPVAIKADGLAAGKGVVVAATRAEAREALEACLVGGAFGDAGRVVVVEEGMSGPEVSLLALSDGRAVARFPAARDYKPIGEGNTGPNTGGMGSVSPVPDVPDALADELLDRVHRPVVAEMARRGTPFSGVLYAGLMMTADGPRVLEFNTRFGDPETQALLPRLGEDALELLTAAADGVLPDRAVRVSAGAAVAVVLASEGYPGTPRTGDAIDGLEEAARMGAEVYHAGTAHGPDGSIVTAGGRVLAVCARGDNVAEARRSAYAAAERITFRGRQMRGDIAAGLDGGAEGTA